MANTSSSQTSVATTGQTVIVPADPNRILLVLANHDGTNPVFVGGANVTASNGMKIPANTTLPPITGPAAAGAVSGQASGGAVVVGALVATSTAGE